MFSLFFFLNVNQAIKIELKFREKSEQKMEKKSLNLACTAII